LERRWNEKLEEVETTKQRLSSLHEKRWSLSSDEEERIRLMGETFAESWDSDRCPPALKKMIFRTAIEEIIVRADTANQNLQFTIHHSLERRYAHATSRWSALVPRLRRRHPWSP